MFQKELILFSLLVSPILAHANDPSSLHIRFDQVQEKLGKVNKSIWNQHDLLRSCFTLLVPGGTTKVRETLENLYETRREILKEYLPLTEQLSAEKRIDAMRTSIHLRTAFFAFEIPVYTYDRPKPPAYRQNQNKIYNKMNMHVSFTNEPGKPLKAVATFYIPEFGTARAEELLLSAKATSNGALFTSNEINLQDGIPITWLFDLPRPSFEKNVFKLQTSFHDDGTVSLVAEILNKYGQIERTASTSLVY
ncbi:MAG: hypothetical protein AB1540_00915 [Bdellovibrionota bacterium]